MIAIDQSEDSSFTVGEESLVARAADVVEEARQTFDQFKTEAYEKAAEVDTFVRTRPYAALGVAVLAGMVIAHILGGHRPQVVVLKEPRRPLIR